MRHIFYAAEWKTGAEVEDGLGSIDELDEYVGGRERNDVDAAESFLNFGVSSTPLCFFDTYN